jgi:ribosome-associated protein
LESQLNLVTQPLALEDLNDLIIDSIQDIKGKNIIKLDLRRLPDSPADYFIICEGDSSTQVRAIAGNVARRVKYEGGMSPAAKEGETVARWICIDYYNVVVHVFYREARAFYELEQLWSDAVLTEYATL